MLDKIHPYYLGAITGGVVGYIAAKIYQIWAIAYQVTRLDPNMQSSWQSDAPPLWVTAVEQPAVFTFWVSVVFIMIGIFFARTILRQIELARK